MSLKYSCVVLFTQSYESSLWRTGCAESGLPLLAGAAVPVAGVGRRLAGHQLRRSVRQLGSFERGHILGRDRVQSQCKRFALQTEVKRLHLRALLE